MRNAISIFFIVILVPITTVMLLVTSVRYHIVAPKFFKQELSRAGVYALATAQIDTQVQKLNIDPGFPITQAEIAAIAHEVLSEPWLRGNVEGIIDSFFSWLNAPEGTALTLQVDLRQPKAVLFSSIDRLLETKLPQIAPCKKSRGVAQQEGICFFAGMSVQQVKTELAHMGFDLAALQARIPDRLDLLKPDLSAIVGPADSATQDDSQQSQAFLDNVHRVKDVYRRVVQYVAYAWIAYGLLLAGYVALNATKGLHRLVRWTGVLFLSIGMLPAAIGFAASPVVEQAVIPKLHLDPKLPAELQAAIPDVIRDAQHALFSLLLVSGLVLVGVGLGAIIGAHWIPVPSKKPG